MQIKLENEWVEALFKEEGAEQTSFKLKVDQCEYLWQADPKVWSRHAPMLFPIVGKLKDNQYELNQKKYNMTQHGFARDSKFEVLEQGKDFVEFLLKSSDITLKQYPYEFQLIIRYELVENTLKTSYKVKNEDEKAIYFSMGAHPGFNCPIIEGEQFSDYYLEFSNGEEFSVRRLTKDFLVSNELFPLEINEGKLPLTDDLFSEGVYIFENMKSSGIILKSDKHSKSVRMYFPEFEYFGIWTVESNPKFICLEPWFGVADFEDSDGEFTTKKGIRFLLPEETFTCSFEVTIS